MQNGMDQGLNQLQDVKVTEESNDSSPREPDDERKLKLLSELAAIQTKKSRVKCALRNGSPSSISLHQNMSEVEEFDIPVMDEEDDLFDDNDFVLKPRANLDEINAPIKSELKNVWTESNKNRSKKFKNKNALDSNWRSSDEIEQIKKWQDEFASAMTKQCGSEVSKNVREILTEGYCHQICGPIVEHVVQKRVTEQDCRRIMERILNEEVTEKSCRNIMTNIAAEEAVEKFSRGYNVGRIILRNHGKMG